MRWKVGDRRTDVSDSGNRLEPAETTFQYVDTPGGLAALAGVLSRSTRFAVDVESDSFYHYFEKVCLLQISVEGVDYIVDPLRVRDLALLRPLFTAPEIEKVLHAASNDIAILSRRHDIEVEGLFDTHIAAQVLGHRHLGLSALLEHYFGVRLEKRYQRYDWSRRPLRPEHLEYARLDTHYLLRLRDALWNDLQRAGRTAQALEEIRRLETRRPARKTFSADDYLRIRGARQLDARGKRVLRELFLARDREARRRDVPPFRVLGNEALIALARARPLTDSGIRATPGVPRRMPPALRSLVLIAVETALQRPEPVAHGSHKASRRPASHPVRRDARSQEALARLKAWRTERALAEDVPEEVVATNAVLQAVAGSAPRTLKELEQLPGVRLWQIERYGLEWLGVLEGSA